MLPSNAVVFTGTSGRIVGDSDETVARGRARTLLSDRPKIRPELAARPLATFHRVCRTRRAHKSAVVKPTSKYGHITTRSPTLVTALIPPSWDRMNATDGSIFSTKRNAERWRVP